ncbi:MAG: hypothetical protein MI810_22510 [Flavobacteriales bacterium]|nr:hypothetical protein [Flavobacteriales bacterium]
MKYTLQQIREVLQKKGYLFFDKNQKAYNLNIIGIRSNNKISNSFDDHLYLIYREEQGGELKVHEFPITTDPGAYWLKNPMNVNGTAILVPGQYRGSHAIGLHQGKYKALKQKSDLKVWRDNNRDKNIDTGGQVYEGIFGINIHRSNASGQSTVVEKWSAGCQVFQKVADFNFFMDICEKSKELNGNSFTYTLLEEKDF